VPLYMKAEFTECAFANIQHKAVLHLVIESGHDANKPSPQNVNALQTIKKNVLG